MVGLGSSALPWPLPHSPASIKSIASSGSSSSRVVCAIAARLLPSRLASAVAVMPGERKAIGLYRAESEAQLGGLLGTLPLSGWMQVTVIPLEPHPNDPS
jgi:hypothetical protein